MKVGIDIQSVNCQATGIKQYKSLGGTDFYYYKDAKNDEPNTLQRMYWENVSLRSMAKRDKIDILHIPGFAGPRARKPFKKVTTVHDVIGMIYPRNLAPISRFYWQRWLPACVKNSDYIIADSVHTKNDITRLLGMPEEKIGVIYLAVDSRFSPLERDNNQKDILTKYNIEKKYILNVGTIEPRKNILNLIEAFRLFTRASKNTDIQLVIAGKKGWDYDRCFARVKDLSMRESVIFCVSIVPST